MRSVNLVGLMIAATFAQNSYADQLMDLNDAISNRSVTIRVQGNLGNNQLSSIAVRNTLPYTINIKVEAGRRFYANENRTQDLLITKTEYIRVIPNQVIVKSLFSLSCEKNDKKPALLDVYSIGKIAEPKLAAMGQFLDKNILYDQEVAQHAIYCITDEEPLTSIVAQDPELTERIKSFVVRTKGIGLPATDEKEKTFMAAFTPVNLSSSKEDQTELVSEVAPLPQPKIEEEKLAPTLKAADAVAKNIHHTSAKRRVVYKFSYKHIYNSPGNGLVSLILYNPHNEKVKELIKNQHVGQGKHAQTISMCSEGFAEGAYAIRLFYNGEMINERKFHLASN